MPLESLDAVYSPRLLGLKRKFRCDEGRNPYLMQVKRIGLVGTIRALTIGLLLITVTQLAAQDDCERVITALTKVITTQSHIYSTTTTAPMGGAPKDPPRMTETIYAAGAAYSRNAGGKWTRSRATLQQVLKLEEANQRNSQQQCRYLRDEGVNGEAAAVYSVHAESADQKSDGQVWISKTSGLPLRKEVDIDISDMGPHGETQKDHRSVRYEYRNVQPPE